MTGKSSEAPAHPNAETLYGMLFQNSLDGLMLTAPDGQILDANPAACRILERTREEIVREGRQGLIDSADPRLAVLIAERQRSGKAHGELTARRKDGTPFPVEISSVVFASQDGSPRTCIIIRDITERKAVEAERERWIQELQETLGQVKTLSGLLPMCASCRKIRDKQGLWHSLELSVRKHTEADFSHGIWPRVPAPTLSGNTASLNRRSLTPASAPHYDCPST